MSKGRHEGMKKEIKRKTNETDIEVSLEFPGKERKIEIGCGFLSHMMTDLMCSRACIGICLKAKGDTEVDFHHLTEDIGITLGQLLREIAKEGGIARYGWCILPMDGSLARVALDFSGRGASYFSGSFPQKNAANSTWNSFPSSSEVLPERGA